MDPSVFKWFLLFLFIHDSLSSPSSTTTSSSNSTSSVSLSTSSPASSTTLLPVNRTIPTSPLITDFFNSTDEEDTNNTCIPPVSKCSDGSCCAYRINIPAATHKYIGGLIIVCFIVGQTIHYFYLEDKKAKEYKADEPPKEKSNLQMPGEHQDDEEKDRRERLAYGISTNSYLVAESKTPGGRVTKVLEKRPRRSFALAPPITPASINGMYESRVKTVQKEEVMVCQMRVTADKWGRGSELISLINDTEVPSSLTTAEDKAKFAMEIVQGHVEKMTEQKVFLHGFLEDRHRLLCGSDNLDGEMFSEVRLELKLEMTAPIPLMISVFLVKVEPQIEQPKTAPPARISELTTIPSKGTPRTEKPQTTEQNNNKKSTVSDSLEEKQGKETKPSPDKKKTEKRDSSRRKTSKKTGDLSELVPLLQQVVQEKEKQSKEKNTTPKLLSAPATPEKPLSGQMPPSIAKKKKKDSSTGQVSNPSPTK